MKLHVVLPAMLVATFAADAVTRAVPLSAWTFRAWEAMRATPTIYAPFEPLDRFDSAQAFGDLANMGAVPRLRIHRRETFSTDEFGYRNPPGLADSGRVTVLLFGDSFAAGSGVADEMTLAAQLASSWGRVTYSLAPFHPTPGSIGGFAQSLKLRPGSWVVHEQTALYNETHALPIAPVRQTKATHYERYARTFRSGVWPLRILASQFWRYALHTLFLPNRLTSQVHLARLRNGDEMLFIAGEALADEVSQDASAAIDQSVRYARAVADAAEKSGLQYLAVLVPIKTAAYRQLVSDTRAADPVVPPVTAEYERRLRAAGLHVANTYEAMAARAAKAASRQQYVFWRDDTHWSPSGIAVGARAIAEAMIRVEHRDR